MTEKYITPEEVSSMTSKQIRERSGMTQVAFAKRFGIPYRTVQNWDSRDNCAPYVKRMIAEILGMLPPR